MPGKITFGIKGAKEMENLLKQLGPNVARRVGQRAARAGVRVFVAEAKRLVRKQTGELEGAITDVAVKSNEEQRVTAALGFFKPTSRRAHLTEYGTAHAPAFPFVRPALDSKSGEALDAMGAEMAKGIEREAKKLAKK